MVVVAVVVVVVVVVFRFFSKKKAFNMRISKKIYPRVNKVDLTRLR